MDGLKRLTHILYSGLGGHGSVFRSFVKADKENNFEVSALFYGIEEVKEDYIEFCKQNEIKLKFVKKNRGLDLGFFFQVFKALKELDPNHVFLHGSYLILPVWFYFLFKKKSIIVRETQANHLKTKFEWLMLFMAQQLSTKMVYLSIKYMNEVNQKFKWFFESSKSFVIPNGIDLEIFSPINFNTNQGILKIGMLSRLVKIKDHETLLKSISILNKRKINVEVYIAGDGETKNQLIELKLKLQLHNVHFLGVIHENEIPDFLKNLDIYIHASFGETMSTSIMQAQACGLPIIASNVSGINNVISNKINGLLVATQNEMELADVIFSLSNRVQDRHRLAIASRSYAEENLSHLKMFESYKMLLP